MVSLEDFGAIGDGVANDTAAISDWITAIMTSGARGYAPVGTYLTDPFSVTTMTGDIEIECAHNAIFKYRTAVATPLFSFSHTTRDVYSVRWSGGIIDNSGGEFNTADQSNTCLHIARLKEVILDGIVFRGESTYGAAATATTGTDSGVTPTDCKRVTITNCVFQGQGDAGIYFTGGSSEASAADDGGDCTVSGCHFIECHLVMTAKRNTRGVIFDGNTIRNCRVGVMALEVTGIGPGRQLIISNNQFKFIETRAIEIKQHDGSIVTGNVIEDFGYQVDGATISAIPFAIRILGTSGAIVSNNQIRNREWAKHANHRGVEIDDATINSVLYTPANNIVQANQFDEVTAGIFEGSGVGVNYYVDNMFDASVTTPFTIGNAHSVIRWPNNCREWNKFGNVGNVGGGEDDLNTITLPAGTLNYNRTSSTDGRRLRITAWGSTANNSNPKTVKLYFGSTAIITTALTISQSGRWQIIAEVVRSGVDAQKVTAQLIQGGTTTLVDCESSSLTEDDGADIVIKVAGFVTDGGGGINNNDIINSCLSVGLVN